LGKNRQKEGEDEKKGNGQGKQTEGRLARKLRVYVERVKKHEQTDPKARTTAGTKRPKHASDRALTSLRGEPACAEQPGYK